MITPHAPIALILASLIRATIQTPSPIPAETACQHKGDFAGSCESVHGRLSVGTGIRIWKVGTKRLLGVPLPGDETFRVCTLPKQLEPMIRTIADKNQVLFADFVIRPLTASRPGHMQKVCIVRVSHIVATKAP
jgi:hypothetical protein